MLGSSARRCSSLRLFVRCRSGLMQAHTHSTLANVPPDHHQQSERYKHDHVLPPHMDVSVNADGEMLEITNLVGVDGEVSRFPFVWLKDNCGCNHCFHSESSSRLTSFAGLDLEDRVASVEAVVATVQDTWDRLGRVPGEGALHGAPLVTDCVRLYWTSGHVSDFPLRWLEERCFTQRRQRQRQSEMDPFSLVETLQVSAGRNAVEVEASAAAIDGAREMQAKVIPRFVFEEMTGGASPSPPCLSSATGAAQQQQQQQRQRQQQHAQSSLEMLGWCHALEKYGVALVQTDNHAGALKHFTQLFGFREWCSYGEFYVVENKQSAGTGTGGTGAGAGTGEAEDGGPRGTQQANNLAYTGLPLPFHTDLPHYASPPQVRSGYTPPISLS
jgi:hypothetical protein